MFKNDIKVNYGTINILIYRLNQYKTALEDMKKAIHSIEKIFNKGKGEAMETFGIKSEELIKKMDGVEKEISDISGILKKYVTDMTAIIKPVSIDKMMRVDRNDIYWNMQTINGTCMGIPMIPMNVGVSSFGDWFDWDEDEEERERRRRNDDKLDEIKRMFCNTVNQVTDMADNLNRLYKKVQNYENMDDKYEKEAKKLKKEYTSFWEGARDFMNKMDEMKISYYKGFFNSVKEFIVGLVKLVGGTLKYAGSATLYLYGEVSGEDVPNWAKECYNDTNEMVLGVLKDPTILVEGLAQGVSDSFEEKGGAYCGGYAVGTVASAIVGTKGMDKLRGLAKGAGVAGKAEKVAAATEGVAETTESTQKIAGTIERAEALEGAEGVSEVLSGADDVARSVESTSTVEESVVSEKPSQIHHYATNKNQKYIQQFETILKKYDLKLDGKWNKELLPHQGRHPNAYHEFVLEQMQQIDEIACGNREIFLELFEENVKSVVRENPEMLYKNYWINGGL